MMMQSFDLDERGATFTCPLCKSITHVPLQPGEAAAVSRWVAGDIARIQDAVPELDATEREMFLTGLCENCQSQLFGQ